MEDVWEKTIANRQTDVDDDAGVGCLLQIHPLEISCQLIRLTGRQTTIGRDPSCGLCISDASVSRKHALIERIGDTYQVTDLGSTNGTCVDEKRVTCHELIPGDRVQFGSFIYKFLATNHIEMQYHEAVYSMITRDGLTGTLNKRSFLDIIHRQFNQSVHRNLDLSLIMMDIDHFKSINDTHGHLAGDEVLLELSRRITAILPEHEVFARYGGEEFAILLAADAGEATEVAENCRQAIESAPFPTCVGPLQVSISLGVADLTTLPHRTKETELIQAADAKLYAAKNAGRNRVCS